MKAIAAGADAVMLVHFSPRRRKPQAEDITGAWPAHTLSTKRHARQSRHKGLVGADTVRSDNGDGRF